MSHPGSITRQQLLDAGITEHQLVRWHKNGLLPRPRVKSLGRGRGVESSYPESALEQALFLRAAIQKYRNLDQVAWLAWSTGYPITGRMRSQLVRNARRELATLRASLDAFEREEPGNPIDDAENQPTPYGVRRIAKDFRPTFVRVLTEIQAGSFRAKRYEPEDLKMVAAYLHPSSQKKRPIHAHDDVGNLMTMLSKAMSTQASLDVLECMSDVRLERVRDDARRLWRFAGDFGGHEMGPLPYGVFWLTLVAKHVSPHARLVLTCMNRAVKDQGFESMGAVMLAMREQERNTQHPSV